MPKRILFVEDNPLLLEMYTMMLDDEREQWQVTTADHPHEALRLLDLIEFDVVVSDMRMPGMSGVELIAEVKKRHPRTSRIILSSLSDQEEVARSLDSTHQFLAKPFEVHELKATLSRIRGLDSYLKDPKLQTLVAQLGTLPSFPTLYLEIMKELSTDDSSIETVAATIAKDPSMTAKMLQIVNSAALGLSRKIGNPFEAVQFLGMGTVRSLVLSAHIFLCFERNNLKGFPMTRLWEHGMKTGRLACLITQVEDAEPGAVEDAYTAGMLHDVGKLMLAHSLPEQFESALTLSAKQKIPLHEAELEIFGATHAGIAAYLLGLWGLPAPIVDAVAFHHAPRRSELQEFSPLTSVHVADVLEHELTQTQSEDRWSNLDMEYLEHVGVANRVEAWRDEVGRVMHLPHV